MKIYKEFPKTKPITPLLDKIVSPSNTRTLKYNDLNKLADEVREFLLFSVSQSGGHFGAGLGAIELTIALHHVLKMPFDKIIWDTGHQAYPHKILTGRKDLMHKIRQLDGLAAFPAISESEFDSLTVGHSSTSISAALGMAQGSKLNDLNKNIFAVIGDGAMTAGIAFEAMMHAGHLKNNLKIILNDNDMSISKNIGGLSNYLASIWASKAYKKIKSSGVRVLEKLPYALHISRTLKEGMKSAIMPGNLFEDLGIKYIGPIDGHDIKKLVKTLKRMVEKNEPYLLHVITKKGAGFEPAENQRIKFHAISKIETAATSNSPKFQDVFGDWLCFKAKKDNKLIGITPAMKEGSGMVNFEQEHPDKFFDVAIAEQHAITFSAGLALEGHKPVVAIYSTFLQRAYDQLIHDVCIEKLDVTFALDRAGVVGEDGPTHSGNFDLAFMRCVPNIVIATPSDEDELWKLLNTLYEHKGPAAVRYPRGSGRGVKINQNEDTVIIGSSRTIRDGSNLCILNFGVLLDRLEDIADKLDCGLLDMRFVKPLDTKALDKILNQYKKIVTVEDHTVSGGAGSAVNEYFSSRLNGVSVLNLGLSDEFPEHGSRSEILKLNSLDQESLSRKITDYFNS